MAQWNLGDAVASALPAYESEFKDQVFNMHPLLNHIKENDGVSKKSGGTTVRVPMLTNSGISQWFQGTDTLDVTHVDTLDASEYSWRNLNASIVFTFDDEMANSGKEQVIDLIEAKIQQAELTIANTLNTSLFTGVAANKQIDGLQTLVGTGSVGGVDGATYSDWRSYVESTSTALTIAQIKVARNTINVGQGGSPVSIIATTQTLHEKLETLYTPTYQMNPMVMNKEVKRLGDVGFEALAYAGIPVVFDPACPSGEMYFLNTKNLKLFVHKDAFMDKTDKRKPINQHLTGQHIVMRCALGTNRRKSLGKLTNKS